MLGRARDRPAFGRFGRRIGRRVAKYAATLGAAGTAYYAASRQPAIGKDRKGNPRRLPKSSKDKVVNKLNRLQTLVSADQGTHIDKRRYTDRVVSAVNSTNHGAKVLNSNSITESVIGNLKYYNPEIPGTLTTADGATGSFTKNFLVDSFYVSVNARNNYQVPCECTVYLVMPKEDTGIAPLTAFTDGLTDVGGPSSASPLIHLTDSPVFNKLYKIVKSMKKILQPGASMNCYYDAGSYIYDPSYNDAHSLTYKPINKALVSIVRIEGVVGHDSSADEQGTLAGGVDYRIDTKMIIKYNAGADLVQYQLTDDSATFTNGGIVSNKPVSDNQAYSAS